MVFKLEQLCLGGYREKEFVHGEHLYGLLHSSRTFSFHLLGCNMYKCHVTTMTCHRSEHISIHRELTFRNVAVTQCWQLICPKFATATICYPLHITVVLVHSTVMKHLPNNRFQILIWASVNKPPRKEKKTEAII